MKATKRHLTAEDNALFARLHAYGKGSLVVVR